MNISYALWRWWVDFHLLPLIQRLNTYYFPIYKPYKVLYLPLYIPPKLLAPNLHSIYTIHIDEDVDMISCHNIEELHLTVGLDIRIYILDLLDILFHQTNTNTFMLTIIIQFSAKEFESGCFKIHEWKDDTTHLNQIIKNVLEKMHELDQKYSIQYIFDVEIQIILYENERNY
jgi:hypothetical protein